MAPAYAATPGSTVHGRPPQPQSGSLAATQNKKGRGRRRPFLPADPTEPAWLEKKRNPRPAQHAGCRRTAAASFHWRAGNWTRSPECGTACSAHPACPAAFTFAEGRGRARIPLLAGLSSGKGGRARGGGKAGGRARGNAAADRRLEADQVGRQRLQGVQRARG